MLAFFIDPSLTVRCTLATPKRFSVPNKGGIKQSTVYLGDPYTAIITEAAVSTDSVLTLDQTEEFLTPSGKAWIGTTKIAYTGVTPTTLTGVSGLPSTVALGTTIRPEKQWVASASIEIFSMGGDTNTLQVSMRVHGTPAFNFPGMPLILGVSAITAGIAGSLAIDLQLGVPKGQTEEFTDWSLSTSPFYAQALTDNSVPDSSVIGISAQLFGYGVRRDQQLPMLERILPSNRSIAANLPGFVYGQYRWRDEQQINRQTLIPTNWNIDTEAIGDQNFLAGIGYGDDLKPVQLVQDGDSIRLKTQRGFYFTGPNSYFWPGLPQLDFLPASGTVLTLSQIPMEIYPVFVGTYQLDAQGFYEKGTEYRYLTPEQVTSGIQIPEYYYTLDRKNKKITLNQAMPSLTYYIGSISGEETDYFTLPIFPIDSVTRVYIDFGSGDQVTAVNWTFDRDLGTLTISNPAGTGPSIPSALQGQAVFIESTPALAALYETANITSRIIDNVDLNPAFSGLSNGYVYLMHSRQEPVSVMLSCDKPQIAIPPTFTSIIGLVAFGPVYFEGDYSLLQIKAFSGVPGQTVPNVTLRAIVDSSTFTGTLNYQDPTVTPVEVTTGADGIANVIFQPKKDFGLYIPKQAPASDGQGGLLAGVSGMGGQASNVLNLPTPGIPLSQMWNVAEGWLIQFYVIINNDPLLGKQGANVSLGEVPFVTSGVPGSFSYKTNGELTRFADTTSKFILPINAYDFAGKSMTDPAFSGMVAQILFPQDFSFENDLVGSYFLAYTQRTLIKFEAVDSNIDSNSLLLQMQMPEAINDDPWLTLDSLSGLLNQYRLGWTIPTPTFFG